MKKRKYTITAIAVLSVIAILVFLAIKNRTPKIRNIVLISIDTCRADYFSCYGYPQATTPHIDALAKNATLFKNVVSPVPITLPAHSSMLTGTIPPFHGVHNNISYKLSPASHTLSEMLNQKGFNTAGIVSSFVLDRKFGLSQGFDTYMDTFKEESKNIYGNERKADETTQMALDWLDKTRDGQSFLFLHYYDPHADYAPPEPFASKFADNLYAGEIAFTDHCIGRFIQKLKDLKLYDSTLIIITGDHGEMLGEHGEEEHTYFIYESAIKVPLIVKLPGQKKGSVVTQPVGLVDIVPTLCSMLDIDTPPQIQGEDITMLLKGQIPDTYERFLFSESLTPTRIGANALMSISTDKWKYIQSKRPELYDVTNDPGEEHNLIGKEAHRGRILEDKLREILEQSVRKDPDSELKLDDKSIRRLQSLGYVAGKVEGDFVFDQSKDDPKDLIEFFAKFHRSIELLEKREYEKAKKIILELIPQRPEFHEIYKQLGAIEMQLGNYDQAILSYKKQIKLSPNDLEGLMNLSGALHKNGEYEEAIKYGLKAVAAFPDDMSAHISLALFFQKAGDLDQALKYYLIALKLSPDNAMLCNNIAGLLIAQGDFDPCLGYLRRSITINPNQPKIMNTLALIQATKPSLPSRNIDEAIMLAQKLCTLSDFNNPHALDTLAISYAAAGEFPKAIEIARKAHFIATSMHDTKLAQKIAEHLKLFTQSKPYTDTPSQ